MRRGFSLLEVMVAIAILGLTLTVILSAQGGLAASNRSAANMGQAVTLGRCKMTEVEEKMLKFGFPLVDQIDQEQPCCEDEVREGFKCDVRVEKIEMPNFTGGNSLGDGGALISPGGSSSPLAALANPAGSAGLNLDVDGGLQGLGSSLTSQLGLGGPGGTGGLGAEGLIGMVMGIVYPSMKPMYEASIRRVTVNVKWKEGPNAREMPMIQYLTNPQGGGFAANALLPDGGVMDFGSGTSPTGTGTAAPTGTSPRLGSPAGPSPGIKP
jgi:general secretion pathway protein I